MIPGRSYGYVGRAELLDHLSGVDVAVVDTGDALDRWLTGVDRAERNCDSALPERWNFTRPDPGTAGESTPWRDVLGVTARA